MAVQSGFSSLIHRLIGKLSIETDEHLAEKRNLIEQLASPHRPIALQALDVLRVRGWLLDGTLQGADLRGVHFNGIILQRANLEAVNLSGAHLSGAHLVEANLAGADLRGANLTGAHLTRANLSGADLQAVFLLEADLRLADLSGATFTGARLGAANLGGASVDDIQLAQCAMLNGAIMPDGWLYDGRFSLPGDIELARFLDIDPADPIGMASFYNVKVAAYLSGQSWSDQLPG